MSSRSFENLFGFLKQTVTQKMIEDAQAVTLTQCRCCPLLGVHYLTYRKYAKIYGLWERHLGPEGVGIKKGYGKYRKPLDQLLSKENRKIRLGLTYLKNRLIDEGWVQEECTCGYNEVVLGKDRVLLRIDFIDGNRDNHRIDNLRITLP